MKSSVAAALRERNYDLLADELGLVVAEILLTLIRGARKFDGDAEGMREYLAGWRAKVAYALEECAKVKKHERDDVFLDYMISYIEAIYLSDARSRT